MKEYVREGDTDVASRLSRIQIDLGPHAQDLVRRYEEASGNNVGKMLARFKGMEGRTIDPLGLGSGFGLIGICAFGSVALSLFGFWMGFISVLAGIVVWFRIIYRMRQHELDRKCLTYACDQFELILPFLSDRETPAEQLIQTHVRVMYLEVKMRGRSEKEFEDFVSVASYFDFTSADSRAVRRSVDAEVKAFERFGPKRLQA